MRDWQVGDPAGDGNDIGVPDVSYMGYLKGGERDSGLEEEFRSNWNDAFDSYRRCDYYHAFLSINSAFSIYKKLSELERSHLTKEPFNREWIIDLCCRTLNEKGNLARSALDIIKEFLLHVKLCMDCDCAYPVSDSYCIRCGKPLTDPFESAPAKVASAVREALSDRVFDDFEMKRVIERTLRLINSNGSRLVKIRPGMFSDFDFVFVKEHRYFKTTYVCAYEPDHYGGRVFEDFKSYHNHERLLDETAFQKQVMAIEDKTGYSFDGCAGGYGYDFDEDHYNFIFTDKISVSARFKTPDGRTALYDIDFDSMKLGDECRIY
ncbi:MAG: hypothetical protein E7Z83_08875 [Methanobrevibacter sp.]|nr:hypothetical protein [Methanobrevibacter sp.]MBE6490953.1 hypothetical protein [Methanobrevibacter sp.]